MTKSSAAMTAALVALLPGCAAVAPPPEAPAPAAEDVRGGRFEVIAGRAGAVVAAPHGTTDAGTDAIGRDLARLTGFSAVVVTGFSHVDGLDSRYNVNRPTESPSGAPAASERETAAARRVYDAYRARVAAAAHGPLALYVEVHGNSHRDTAGRIEIATVGIGRDDAWRLKTLFELIRDAQLAGGNAPRLEVSVEGLDPLRYTASASKRSGMLGAAPRALHIELPRAARTEYRAVYTEILARFLGQSAPLLLTGSR